MTTVLSTGTFTSDGTAFNLSLPSGFDEFEMVNITDVGSAAAATPVMRAYFSSSMAAGSAYRNLKTNGAATLALEDMITANGFTLFDNGNPPTFALVAGGTSITQAFPAVVTLNAHGFATGDTVVLSGCTGMEVLNGLSFTVTVTGANTFTIPIDTSGFAAPATAVSARKFIPNAFFPKNHIIGPVAGANGLVLRTNTNHGYAVGAKIRVNVPSGFGMTQADGLVGTVTAVTATTITTDINGAAFTALTYPASAVGVRTSYPSVSGIGEVATILTQAEDNQGIRGITVGTSVQTSGKLYQWFCRKGNSI